MLSSPTDLEELISLAPEWEPVARSLSEGGQATRLLDLFNRLGAKALYLKALDLGEERGRFLVLARDCYFQAHLSKMLQSNQNLRRFWAQRKLSAEEQRLQAISFAGELSQKMEGVLIKHLNHNAEDGFKVLLPAYMQRAVQNAVVDYIRQEWSWERQTLQDMYLDPEQEDPRSNIAADVKDAPEHMALSNEQVGQLNQFRTELEEMLADPSYPADALAVIDCMFGLGLTKHSIAGSQMTMRECCDKLAIAGETQARRIARCQVLYDKALDLIRQRIREKLPGIVDAWQGELNVNCASRRELSQQLELTEGEVERLIKNRQYYYLKELVERAVIKPQRLPDIEKRGAVAAFVPVDLNSSTVRDLIDILGLPKDLAQKLASERPYKAIEELSARGLTEPALVDQLVKKGAVLKTTVADSKRIDLNRAELSDIVAAGVNDELAKQVTKGRPFVTWSELEDFLGCDPACWSVLRQKFCLGLTSA